MFFSYSHEDEKLRDRLEKHLAMLKKQGVIETWHDRRIEAGDDLSGKIGANLEKADLILLLVSPDFLASDYCYDVEMQRALERHEAGEARVIPIILRACDWKSAPFGKLKALPKDGKPVTSWPDLDEAFLDITKAIRSAVQSEERADTSLRNSAPPAKTEESIPRAQHVSTSPRSSNLRLKKEFTDADRDRFLEQGFEYMAAFFENSLNELKARNSQIEFSFRRVDANRFVSKVYKAGKAISACTIFLGSMLGKGIYLSEGETHANNSHNESMSVESDDQGLYLVPFGMGRSSQEGTHLTFEGAAEYYWSRFIERLQ